MKMVLLIFGFACAVNAQVLSVRLAKDGTESVTPKISIAKPFMVMPPISYATSAPNVVVFKAEYPNTNQWWNWNFLINGLLVKEEAEKHPENDCYGHEILFHLVGTNAPVTNLLAQLQSTTNFTFWLNLTNQ